jgi:hypothetical protein
MKTTTSPNQTYQRRGLGLLALSVAALLVPLHLRADYESTVLSDSPIAYYPLDLTNGTAADLSGNGNDGTYINIYPGYNNVPGPSPYITNAVSFDGVSTYVDLSTGANPGLLNFGGQITMEAWVQPDSSSENGYIWGKGYDSGQNGNEISLRCPGYGVYQGGIYNDTLGDVRATGGSVTTNWAHVVCNYDGTNWNLYVNAILVNSNPSTNGNLDFVDPWAIGDGTVSGASRIFTGNITHAALYTNALSATRVAAHYLYGLYGTYNLPPMILQQPVSQAPTPGASVTFSVSVLSALPTTQQWYFNTNLIANATNLSLTLNNVQTTNSGNYTVVISNTSGSTNSAAATLSILTEGVYGVSPVPASGNTFNYDTVVEASAAPPLVTTATLDEGTGNYGYTWYETGWNGQTGTGLPNAGTLATNATLPDHVYQMAPSFTTNDAILIDSTVSNATITPTSAAAVSYLSFLMSSGGGAMGINYVVHHTSGPDDTGTITSPDWFSPTTVAIIVNGRVDARTRSFQSWGSGGPAVSSQDITNANANPVTSIDLSWSSGSGHACILAVSGSASGSGFNPIAFTGYNESMIMNAGAGAPSFTGGAYTTASVDNGPANTGFSWYEEGFEVPGRGVPPHNTVFTSLSLADHEFRVASSYTTNDVWLIDANNGATNVLAVPAKLWKLSFLGAAGHGPFNINYVVRHADSSSESGTFALPDWFGSGTTAWNVDGRIDVQGGSLQTWGVGSGVVKLFSADVGVFNLNSPVTSIEFSEGSGNQSYADAQIFAVSAAYLSQSHQFTSIQKNGNGSTTLNFSGVPGYNYQLQYATSLTPPVAWHNLNVNTCDGNGNWQAVDAGAAGRPTAFYRAVYLP